LLAKSYHIGDCFVFGKERAAIMLLSIEKKEVGFIWLSDYEWQDTSRAWFLANARPAACPTGPLTDQQESEVYKRYRSSHGKQ